MTKSARAVLGELYDEFHDRVAFATLYVREAHPGERTPQPRTFAEKLELARRYRERDAVPWPVAVDSVEGDLHRALDPRPSSAYLMDRYGRVAQRVLWSNDAPALKSGLDAVARGYGVEEPEVEHRLVPMLSGIGVMDEVLAMGGPGAGRDFLRAVPPVYLTAKLARLFRPLRPAARGAAALSVLVLGTAGLVAGGWVLARRARR